MAEFCSEPERFFGSVREARRGGGAHTAYCRAVMSMCYLFVGLCFVLLRCSWARLGLCLCKSMHFGGFLAVYGGFQND